jgi:hypothetical protein
MRNPVKRSSWGIFILQNLFALKLRKASEAGGGGGGGGGFRGGARVENKRDFKSDKEHVDNSKSKKDLNGFLPA